MVRGKVGIAHRYADIRVAENALQHDNIAAGHHKVAVFYT